MSAPDTPSDTLARLEATIAQRRQADPSSSYVARLNAKGIKKIAQKVGEEGTETVIAALAEDEAALVGEAADCSDAWQFAGRWVGSDGRFGRAVPERRLRMIWRRIITRRQACTHTTKRTFP